MLTGLWAWMHNNRAKKSSRRVLEGLHINSGDVIADLGSGGGYFTFEFAKRVGDNGRVFAIDTNKRLLRYIEAKCKMYRLQNVVTVHGRDSGFTLPISCDLMFMRNVLHHLNDPVPYLKNAKASLKDDGRVAIIERIPGAKDSRAFHAGHAMPEADIRKTMEEAGFKHLESYSFLEGQSFNIWQR